jgi:hypothetical protein
MGLTKTSLWLWMTSRCDIAGVAWFINMFFYGKLSLKLAEPFRLAMITIDPDYVL